MAVSSSRPAPRSPVVPINSRATPAMGVRFAPPAYSACRRSSSLTGSSRGRAPSQSTRSARTCPEHSGLRAAQLSPHFYCSSQPSYCPSSCRRRFTLVGLAPHSARARDRRCGLCGPPPLCFGRGTTSTCRARRLLGGERTGGSQARYGIALRTPFCGSRAAGGRQVASSDSKGLTRPDPAGATSIELGPNRPTRVARARRACRSQGPLDRQPSARIIRTCLGGTFVRLSARQLIVGAVLLALLTYEQPRLSERGRSRVPRPGTRSD